MAWASGNNIANLVNGGSETLTIMARVNTAGDYTNIAEINALNQLDTDSTPNNGLSAEDDQDEVTVVPRQLVDISVAKVVYNSTPNIRSTVGLTLTIRKDGQSDATTEVDIVDLAVP